MAESFIVPARFCGPPNSGNGGYTCGMLASEIGGIVECTLRKPVPLDAPLRIERRNSSANLVKGDEIIVEAIPSEITLQLPELVSEKLVAGAMEHSPALDAVHPFPGCFVCGPHRQVGDGLRIFPGAMMEGSLFGAIWLPAKEFGNAQGFLRTEFLWAALDCPTGFAAGFPLTGKLVTGRLAVEQREQVKTGAECTLLSWPLGTEGRKHFSGACLYQHQKVCAVARATWIRLDESTKRNC